MFQSFHFEHPRRGGRGGGDAFNQYTQGDRGGGRGGQHPIATQHYRPPAPGSRQPLLVGPSPLVPRGRGRGHAESARGRERGRRGQGKRYVDDQQVVITHPGNAQQRGRRPDNRARGVKSKRAAPSTASVNDTAVCTKQQAKRHRRRMRDEEARNALPMTQHHTNKAAMEPMESSSTPNHRLLPSSSSSDSDDQSPPPKKMNTNMAVSHESRARRKESSSSSSSGSSSSGLSPSDSSETKTTGRSVIGTTPERPPKPMLTSVLPVPAIASLPSPNLKRLPLVYVKRPPVDDDWKAPPEQAPVQWPHGSLVENAGTAYEVVGEEHLTTATKEKKKRRSSRTAVSSSPPAMPITDMYMTMTSPRRPPSETSEGGGNERGLSKVEIQNWKILGYDLVTAEKEMGADIATLLAAQKKYVSLSVAAGRLAKMMEKQRPTIVATKLAVLDRQWAVTGTVHEARQSTRIDQLTAIHEQLNDGQPIDEALVRCQRMLD